MYAKLFTLAALATAAFAGAIPPTGSTTNKCNVGSVQCCNNVQSADSKTVQGIAQGNALIAAALALAPMTVPVGLTCNPISALGVGGNSCSAQPVCCENNNFNGVVAIGCTPINANL